MGQMGARIDFKEEFQGPNPAEFRVTEVLHIEDAPGPDMAFLRVDWGTGDQRAPIRLATSTETGRGVAVIGYPAKDSHPYSRRDGSDLRVGVQRQAPGTR